MNVFYVEYTFIDSEGKDRKELQELLDYMQAQDVLVIRSVLDLTDTLEDLLVLFEKLTERQISLC